MTAVDETINLVRNTPVVLLIVYLHDMICCFPFRSGAPFCIGMNEWCCPLTSKKQKIPGADSAGNMCHSVRLKTDSIEIELLSGHGVQYLTWVNVNTGNEYFILPPDEAGSSERMQYIIIFL